MFVAGSEIGSSSIRDTLKSRTAVLLGSAGQLAALPLVALAVVAATNPTPIVSSSVLILGLCPGGGISNFYVYLARCNVFLSAIITGVATLLSLTTIPCCLLLLSYRNPDFAPLHDIPVGRILSQLVALMILPLVIGSLFARCFPAATAWLRRALKLASSALVLIILATALWSVRGSLDAYIKEMLICAALFYVWRHVRRRSSRSVEFRQRSDCSDNRSRHAQRGGGAPARRNRPLTSGFWCLCELHVGLFLPSK